MAVTPGSYDPRIDAFIEQSADFAKPILEHIRALVHRTCPEVEESIKWRMPFFLYQGGILCYATAFKAHCAMGFWKASRLKDAAGVLQVEEKESGGNLGRLTTLKDLPSDKVLAALLKDAMTLIELQGTTVTEKAVKKASPARSAAAPLPVPPALEAALKKAPKAKATFEAFSSSHRKEYIEWITEAKTDATREKRVATTIEWLTEGKPRNWKYR